MKKRIVYIDSCSEDLEERLQEFRNDEVPLEANVLEFSKETLSRIRSYVRTQERLFREQLLKYPHICLFPPDSLTDAEYSDLVVRINNELAEHLGHREFVAFSTYAVGTYRTMSHGIMFRDRGDAMRFKLLYS